MKKTYVLDTNVLLSDPNSLFSFEDNDLIIPMVVLEELDKQKSRQDEVGKNARHVSRSLDTLRSDGSLINGVKLRSGGTLRIAQISAVHLDKLPFELQSSKVDNMIIAFMVCLHAELEGPEGLPVPILVSKDINVRIKCDSLGIKCEDYLKMRVASDTKEFYRGVDVIEVNDDFIEKFYAGETIEFPRSANVGSTNSNFALFKGHALYPNEIVVLKCSSGQTPKSAIAKCKCVDDGKVARLVPIKKIDKAFGLSPRNKEQTFSLDLLFDEDVKLLTLVGPSGTGKTLLALAAALEQLKVYGGVPRYEKVIVTRPVQPVGNDMGFLPGTLKEKMEPWISPIRDNMEFLMRTTQKGTAPKTRNRIEESFLDLLQQRGLIEIEAITYVRGRSIPNAFLVLDEAQNLSMHELKTIVTRVGDNTKIVLTGDIEQIDNVHVDAFTNGLTYAVERFRNYELAGHVTLIKGERSKLATLASKIL